jgi:ribosomal protein S3
MLDWLLKICRTDQSAYQYRRAMKRAIQKPAAGAEGVKIEVAGSLTR